MLQKIWKKFVFLRGIAAAFAVLSFVPQFFPFEQMDILRAVRAVIFNWNHLAAIVGDLIGSIPFFPELSARTVNFLILATTVSVPAFYAMWPGRAYANERSGTIALISSIFAMMIFITVQFNFDLPLDAYRVLVVALLLTMIIFLLPVYRSGLVFVIAVLVTFEAVYWLNLPQFRDSVDRFICQAEQMSAEECVEASLMQGK
mgnify:CR=1 FL=1